MREHPILGGHARGPVPAGVLPQIGEHALERLAREPRIAQHPLERLAQAPVLPRPELAHAAGVALLA
ncbi:MAG TPA: hypothetical protein VFY87_09590, partial [Geminicoccaceae bacterium]|nr:hypothetical protein [Geminicoccaceae bacterium]